METKICTKCNRELPLNCFNFKYKNLNKRHTICKECQRRYKKESYYRHYDENKEKFKERRNSRFLEQKDFLYKIKKSGCIVCGETEPCCLDFHHLDPSTKDFTIGASLGASYEKIQREIDKCVIVCANCHRKIHNGILNIKDYI